MDNLQASAGQRERLEMSTERLNQSSDRIKESRRAVFETEELGVSILQDLHQQRETLLNSHAKVFYSCIFPPILWHSKGCQFRNVIASNGLYGLADTCKDKYRL